MLLDARRGRGADVILKKGRVSRVWGEESRGEELALPGPGESRTSAAETFAGENGRILKSPMCSEGKERPEKRPSYTVGVKGRGVDVVGKREESQIERGGEELTNKKRGWVAKSKGLGVKEKKRRTLHYSHKESTGARRMDDENIGGGR